MKILQLTNKVPYPPRDGGAIASLTLARELVRAGHEVVVLAMNTSKHFVDENTTDGKPVENIRWEIVPVNTTIRRTTALKNLLFSRLPYNAIRFISDDYRRKLLALLAENDFDFLILDNLYTGLYLEDIRSHSSVPVVLRSHNIEHEIWARTAKSSVGWKRLYLTILARRIKRFELSLINRYDALVLRKQKALSCFAHRNGYASPDGREFRYLQSISGTFGSPRLAAQSKWHPLVYQDGLAFDQKRNSGNRISSGRSQRTGQIRSPGSGPGGSISW